MGIYAWFIFKFYRFVAKKDIFDKDIFGSDKDCRGFFSILFHGISYTLKYLIIFPILTFFWVIVLSSILAFLSKTDNMSNILLVSMALVGVIRIMAYYSEDLSKDLSKMLPFALLGVFLIDISYFSINDSINAILQLPSLWKVAAYYFVFIILLEFVLRIGSLFSPEKSKKEKEEE